MIVKNKKIIIGNEEKDNTNTNLSKAWCINQCGYDVNKSKRATFTNGIRGKIFYLKNTNDEIVYSNFIKNQIADFSRFTTVGEYYLECDSVKSYTFKIEESRMFNVSIPLAVKFMEMSRQDTFDVGGNSGYGWRDSHQFSFELNSLVMMYMSNPDYYNSQPYDVYKVSECEYTELQTQKEPNIIWLMKFGSTRYYDWCVNKGVQLHALIKGQLAYFLYLYPHISNYVSESFYTQIRDFTINQWSVSTCNKSWYEVDGGISHNLFETQSKIGTTKGQLPPAYAIVPNLMMWEVAKRDGLENAQDFFDSAYNNMTWIVNDVDLSNPSYTKGQRMSEYITFHSITYFYEMYPDLCPTGTYEKILDIAKVLISRSVNMWDYTQYQTEGDLHGATSTVWVNTETQGSGLCNNPGYTGMMAVYYSLARVIEDETIQNKLKQLAVSHLDHAYGRNPLGRHYCYTATDEFDDAKLGWKERLNGGYGNLQYCVGVLDGSPKEENFPYNPSGSTGYNEGWVAFNSAWNMGLAYMTAETSTNGIGIFSK